MVFRELNKLCTSPLKTDKQTLNAYNLGCQKQQQDQDIVEKIIKPVKKTEDDKFSLNGKQSLEMLCRRHGFELIDPDTKTVYCSKAGQGCLYQSQTQNRQGKYDCMNLEKRRGSLY